MANTNRAMCSGIASVPRTGSTAYDEPSTPLHHRGALVGAGRELPRRCMGHITPVEWSQLHSSPAVTCVPLAGVEAASTIVAEPMTATWHTATASAQPAARARRCRRNAVTR